MTRRLRALALALGALLFASLPFWAPIVADQVMGSAGFSTLPITPEVVSVTRGKVVRTLRTRGVVVPEHAAAVRSPSAGRVQGVLAQVGDIVAEGQPLVRLAGGGLVIPAPIAGRLVGLTTGEGDRIETGQVVGRIDSTVLLVMTPVEPSVASSLPDRPDPVTVVFGGDPPGSPETPCTYLGARRSPGSLDTPPYPSAREPFEYEVACRLPEQVQPLAGTPAELRLEASTGDGVLVVPRSVVSGTAGSATVTKVLDGGRKEEVSVTLGMVGERLTEIRSGLAEGDRVLDPIRSDLSPLAT